MVHYLNEGGWVMYVLLAIMIGGIVIILVKLWALMRARIDSRMFVKTIIDTIDKKGTKEAANLCEKTRGPVSAVLHAGLVRAEKDLTFVERAMENEAAIQMGFLEQGMTWIAMVIAVAPMVGFFGTVIGMIGAFEVIKTMNDIVPSEVAGGISVALLTTSFGLIIAVPAQIMYNLFVNMIDNMIIDMEDSSNVIIEHLLDKGLLKK